MIGIGVALTVCWIVNVSVVCRPALSEIGRFLSREFQDNINAFEKEVEPRLGEPGAGFGFNGDPDATDDGCDRDADCILSVSR